LEGVWEGNGGKVEREQEEREGKEGDE